MIQYYSIDLLEKLTISPKVVLVLHTGGTISSKLTLLKKFVANPNIIPWTMSLFLRRHSSYVLMFSIFLALTWHRSMLQCTKADGYSTVLWLLTERTLLEETAYFDTMELLNIPVVFWLVPCGASNELVSVMAIITCLHFCVAVMKKARGKGVLVNKEWWNPFCKIRNKNTYNKYTRNSFKRHHGLTLALIMKEISF